MPTDSTFRVVPTATPEAVSIAKVRSRSIARSIEHGRIAGIYTAVLHPAGLPITGNDTVDAAAARSRQRIEAGRQLDGADVALLLDEDTPWTKQVEAFYATSVNAQAI